MKVEHLMMEIVGFAARLRDATHPQPTLLRCIQCGRWVEQAEARVEFPMGCICKQHGEKK